MFSVQAQFVNTSMHHPDPINIGTSSTGASGTDDPTAANLSDSVLFYEQFNADGSPKATWARQNASSDWQMIIQSQ